MLEDTNTAAAERAGYKRQGRAATAAARETQALDLEAMFAKTGDGVFVINGNGVIQYWNPMAEKILGYKPEDVKGSLCRTIFNGTDRDGNLLCHELCWVKMQALEGNPINHFEMRTSTAKKQQVWLDISTITIPASLAGRTLVAYLFRDITVDREIATLVRNTVQAVQVEAKPAEMLDTSELTARQLEVLVLLRAGASTPEVAKELGISLTTVRNHVQNIFARLEVHNRLEMMAKVHGFNSAAAR